MTNLRDLRFELDLSDWTDVTPDLIGEGIGITRGRPDEGQHVDPAQATVSLRNLTGKYSPRNPVGPYYGLIGRNTTARLSTFRRNWRAATTIDLVDKTAQLAPSIDSPWSTARLFCAWAGPAPATTYTYPGGMTGVTAFSDAKSTMGSANEVITSQGPTGTRTGTMGVAEDYLSASVLLSGNITIRETESDSDSVYATDSGTQAGDWLLVFTYWAWDDEDAAIPHTPVMDEGGWILLGDTGTVNAADADATFFRMKAWLKRIKTPGVHNIHTAGPTTNLTVMRVLTGVTAWYPRMIGEASSWPQEGVMGGQHAQTTAEIAGVMQRLGQGDDSLNSALARRVPTRVPSRLQYASGQGVVAYWPMEDPQGSAVFASGLPGGSPMVVSGPQNIEFAGQDGPPGSTNLPVLNNGSAAFGAVPATTPYGSNPTIIKNLTAPWRVDSLFFVATQPPADRTCLTIRTSSLTAARWEFRCGTDLKVQVSDDDDVVFHTTSQTLPATFYNNWIHFDLIVSQSGSNVAYVAHARAIDGIILATWNVTISGTRTTGRPSSVGLRVLSEEIRSIGHIVVSQDSVASPVDPMGGAVDGFTNESAADRFERLCHEEDVECELVGDDASSAASVTPRTVAMGPQKPLGLLALLQECADADQGIMYEPRGILGVGFRTRASLYNRPAVFSLPYGSGVFADPPKSVDDDQATRNDITASRPGGSSVRVQQLTGPLSIQPRPDGVGRYTNEFEVNVANDSQLDDAAGWALHLGTVDAARFPSIRMHLGVRVSDLAYDLDVGDRFTLTNLPAWAATGSVDLIAQGFTEDITTGHHDVTVNCTPESPWEVAVWQSVIAAAGDKWDTAGSELASGVTSTATSLSVATTNGPVWTTQPAQIQSSVDFPGTSGSYATTPDTAVLDITSDIDLRALVALDDWTPAADTWILSKAQASGSSRSYALYVATGGQLSLVWSADGSALITKTSTVATGFVDGSTHWIRATLDVNNGAAGNDVIFYTSDDGVTWTQLGTTVTTAGTTSIFAGTNPLEIGARSAGTTNMLAGKFYRAEVRNLIGGTVVTNPIVKPNTITDSVGGLPYAVNGSVTFDGPMDLLIGGERMSVVDIAGTTSPQTFTVTRSVNGVVKAHSTAAAVRLWKTPIWAL